MTPALPHRTTAPHDEDDDGPAHLLADLPRRITDPEDEDVTRAQDEAVTRLIRAAVGTDARERALTGDVRALVLAYGQCARGGYLRYGDEVPGFLRTPVQTLAHGLAEVSPIVPYVLRVLMSAADQAVRARGMDDQDVDEWLVANAERMLHPGHSPVWARHALDIWRGIAPISITVLIEAASAMQAMPEIMELLAGLIWHAVTGD